MTAPHNNGNAEIIHVESAKIYSFDASASDILNAYEKSGDLIIEFADGKTVILSGYDTHVGVGFQLNDGQILTGSEFLNAVHLAEEMVLHENAVKLNVPEKFVYNALAQSLKELTEEGNPLATIAEQLKKEKEGENGQKVVSAEDIAEQLAGIEPAAGGASGNSGFTFDNFESEQAPGLQAIGALGATQLTPDQIDIPEDSFFIEQPEPSENPALNPFLEVSDLQVLEDHQVQLDITAIPDSSDGVLTITIDFPTGWTVSGLGSFSSGTWTFVTQAGESFAGGPNVQPPQDSDIDLSDLEVTVEEFSAQTGQTATTKDTFDVIVDAVADVPGLIAKGGSGEEGEPIPVSISGHVVDTDGSESITGYKIKLSEGGFTFTDGVNPVGTQISPTVWSFTPGEIANLHIVPNKESFHGKVTLSISVFNVDTPTDIDFIDDNNNEGNIDALVINVNWEDDDQPEIICIHPAKAVVDETDLDPTDTASGSVSVDFGDDGPGSVGPSGAHAFSFWGSAKDGQLTSNGVPVVVSVSGDKYVGKAGNDIVFELEIKDNGQYTFTLFGTLDHADPGDPDDVIGLSFGVTASDSDGDTDTANIHVKVHDDGPVAVDDNGGSISHVGQTVSGNVLDNDDTGADIPGTVTKINGQVVGPNGTTVQGQFGTLTIHQDGSYSYTGAQHTIGAEQFTYTMADADGDSSSAKLNFHLSCPKDDNPEIGKVFKPVDETNLEHGALMVSGIVPHDFGDDGAGSIMPDGNFTTVFQVGGQPQTLTSNGQTVVVTATSNGYVGKVGDTTVFTLNIDPQTGKFTYKQFEAVDHPDGYNPDDVIWFKFGVKITDSDGDVDYGTIGIDVHDDGPVAHDDTNSVGDSGGGQCDCPTDGGHDYYAGGSQYDDYNTYWSSFYYSQSSFGTYSHQDYTQYSYSSSDPYSTPSTGSNSVSGNVLSNDKVEADDPGHVTHVTFNGQTVSVPASGSVTIQGDHGTLEIFRNGDYTYTTDDHAGPGTDIFTYTMSDADGDKDTADLSIEVTGSDAPVAYDDYYTVFELDASIYDVDPNDNTKIVHKHHGSTSYGSGSYSYNGYNFSFSDSLYSGFQLEGGATVYQDTDTDKGGFIYALNVLDNDHDPDGDPLTIGKIYNVSGLPNNTKLEISPDGTFILLHVGQDSNFNDSILSFEYTVHDSNGACDTGHVEVKIKDQNSPLVLDLDGDGLELIGQENGVLFDIDNDGKEELTGWVKADDGLLALDINGDGIINNQSELFGNNALYEDGFANLASYDLNEDGVIDDKDDVFSDLLVWQDLNTDGISQEGELLSLTDLGITSINLNAQETNYDIKGNLVTAESTFTYADGSVNTLADVWFLASAADNTSEQSEETESGEGEQSYDDLVVSDTDTQKAIDEFVANTSTEAVIGDNASQDTTSGFNLAALEAENQEDLRTETIIA